MDKDLDEGRALVLVVTAGGWSDGEGITSFPAVLQHWHLSRE